MAHMLETVDGKAQMAYTGQTPWHKLGTPVPEDLTPAQMLEAAGLDWRVEKHPLFAEIGGERVPTSAEALVRDRDGKILSIVTDSWNPVQNEEAFEFFNEFVNAGDMTMDTAGSLRGGRQVWALAKIKDSFFELFGGDRSEGYLLFSNPHQFGKAIEIRFTAVRVVCNNTITMALNASSKNKVSINHRSIFDPLAVKETMGLATDKFATYRDMAQFLGSKRYKDENVVEYFNRVFSNDDPKHESRAATKAFDLLETQPGAEFARGSWWQALNSVTYLADHKMGRSDDGRLTSAWFGANATRKKRALNLAMEYADAA